MPNGVLVDLLELAEDHAADARERALEAIASASAAGDVPSEVRAGRALGVALRLLDQHEESLAALDQAIDRAGDDERLAAEVRISRGGTLMALEEIDAALTDLRIAIGVLTGPMNAVALGARGAVLARIDADTARTDLDAGIPVLRAAGLRMYEAHALTNRGLLRTYAADLDAAREDLERAFDLYHAIGLRNAAAIARHNLAFLAARRGALAESLHLFEVARRELEAAGQPLGPLALDHCEVLLSAGMPVEASAEAEAAETALSAAGDEIDAAEAALLAGIAAHRAGDHELATSWLRKAHDRLLRQGRTVWAHRAAMQLLIATADVQDPMTVTELIVHLRCGGDELGAVEAEVHAALWSPPAELTAWTGVMEERWRMRQRLPVEARLSIATARARLADRAGDEVRASAALRDGLSALDETQRVIASIDVRSHVSAHAHELFVTGRRMAVRSGRIAERFRWFERTRANALRYRPVVRPVDGELAMQLDHLRMLDTNLLRAEGAARTELERSKLERQQTIAALERSRPPSTLTASRVVSMDRLRERLNGWTLVEIGESDGAVSAVRVARRATIVELGRLDDIVATAGALRSSLRRLARRTTAPSSIRSSLELVARLTADLDDRLVRPLALGYGPVVLVVPPSLLRVPWGLLPGLIDVPHTIGPSATTWNMAAARPEPSTPTTPQMVAFCGQRLAGAASEIRRVAEVRSIDRALDADKASAGAVRELLDGARAAHVAAHFSTHAGNPLLSAIELRDGPLYVHDLVSVNQLPEELVLSACDSGSGAGLAGDEILGLFSALLLHGARTIVAAINLVPDDEATTELVVNYHAGVAAGRSPAEALAVARRVVLGSGEPTGVVAAAVFCCFGAG